MACSAIALLLFSVSAFRCSFRCCRFLLLRNCLVIIRYCYFIFFEPYRFCKFLFRQRLARNFRFDELIVLDAILTPVDHMGLQVIINKVRLGKIVEAIYFS
ncbi:hypothetical protein BAQU_0826 [Bifidobacterium aquikefiri]|uniref:Uncharacterized protein n=1 Tax=Bifidobacterium aquikefiri TaxID=1653207 RepID=A0A261G5T1_9BIFI|nr:hypothetical protein BAQU_0826 [Bifidobacterium aquikefiri]